MSTIEQLEYLDYLSKHDKKEYKGHETYHKNLVWNKIKEHTIVGNAKFFDSLRTIDGNTQKIERQLIARIQEQFQQLNLTFTNAGSQQSRDFRNVGGVGLNIEVKKTDSNMIYFNDTLPSKDIYYIVVYTGKRYKTRPNLPPKIIYCNGEQFIKDSPWIEDYQQELERLKDKYARGDAKKKLPGMMSVYPRPTYKANISSFIQSEVP
jgi:hypothetical protein